MCILGRYLCDYLYILLPTVKSSPLQAKGKIGQSCIMMARALLVHWLSSPVSFGGHPSSVVLMRFASSCVKNQGGLYYCLADERDGNIPFGVMGRVVSV